MFDDQQCDGDRGQAPGRRGDLAGSSGDGMQRRVQDESPENTLRDGKGERNQDQRRERRHRDLQAIERDARHRLEHRDADEDQHRGRRVGRNRAGDRRDEQARQEAERRDDRRQCRCVRPCGCRRCSRHTRFPTSCRRAPRRASRTASTIRPWRRFFGSPLSSTRFAACATPMNVDSESNRSVSITVIIAGASDHLSAPQISSFRNTLEKSGALNHDAGGVT